jgi:hypothetical protein
LGGSPARMLFVLNRIDVFRSDKDWPESEERFVQRTEKDIKAKLADYLPEYTDEIENVQIVKLSALPALLSLILKGDLSAATRLDKNFNFLIPEDLLDDLPRKVQQWKEHDCKRVSESVWKTAYADRFHADLKNHIQFNFSQLITPQAINKFKDSVAELIKWASQNTRAFINSSEDEYQKECQSIYLTKIKLSRFIEDKAGELRLPFNKIDDIFQNANSTSDPVTQIEKIIRNLTTTEGSYKSIAPKLIPIYDWRRAVTEGIQKTLDPVLDSLEKGKILLYAPTFSTTKKSYVTLLERHIQDLINLKYDAKAGTQIEARTDKEKEQLRKLNSKLSVFSQVLQLLPELGKNKSQLKLELNEYGGLCGCGKKMSWVLKLRS